MVILNWEKFGGQLVRWWIKSSTISVKMMISIGVKRQGIKGW